MGEDLKKMAENLLTFNSQMLLHPYCGIPTFFGTPIQENIDDLDIALVGVPFELKEATRNTTIQRLPAS